MRDETTIKSKSVLVHTSNENVYQIIPEGIKFQEGKGWILNCWDVTRKIEMDICLSDVDEWIPFQQSERPF